MSPITAMLELENWTEIKAGSSHSAPASGFVFTNWADFYQLDIERRVS